MTALQIAPESYPPDLPAAREADGRDFAVLCLAITVCVLLAWWLSRGNTR